MGDFRQAVKFTLQFFNQMWSLSKHTPADYPNRKQVESALSSRHSLISQHYVQTCTRIPISEFTLTLSLGLSASASACPPRPSNRSMSTGKEKHSLTTLAVTIPCIFRFSVHPQTKCTTRPLSRRWPFANKQSLCVCAEGKIWTMQADTKLSTACIQ